ncbi:bifunctional demethylmenaquinone methyltransferase/2-methoxy-6-polyprenyl-1,4-benzoquinol methylase UbiE [Ensifer adhaerens]|jgi:demethylmenaquinone methyltransferase/2-methoxy-6-polyprenyl-1,4-benzoquinol methylase|uniref:bifunctional demethylmenaquinone methyltransferase/2-methoxy-6-polyprenyl-1,4-benzoquinol methylase UbiE n=1 Tax=Ensifer TaxID=106591 RepID=UPI00072A3475|nr:MULTISPECIES: bifunctional demethylmenaquinone methyltransferase/2-methoxy-6-polyprenyl-1,4-benzoquinol methylase UbiE [Ensifer]KSV82585.1 ubiquinone/menaquinone biosynthesis methyltransferase [Sinorhizobium sp. GL2]MBD9567689.1 bifunctional demethylmenaquinone methyltransferase/2-methoxy-6-polyprenyl-1,4-benzoquinol methylase UbiE [Ensifer sp. ENS08]MCY1742160.1 bifunctional demethylmenaquinone methyltransferase/2-methoxy-6-polyprenyl-1,4-benzoquinol methylase UbiE [Ensifer sp. SL37]MDF8352
MTDQRVSADGGMETSFGFRNVGTGEKQPLVNDVFHKVAKRYDIMNDVMSAGLHRAWKDAMIAALNPPRREGYRTLDVAGGTGDIAFRIIEASDRKAHSTVLDINGSMLAVGAERAEKKKLSANLDFVEANAEDLPFEANTFDAYTIAFGIRNVPRIDVALREAYRVLKRGGRLLVLEFSEVEMPLLDRFYDAWSFNAIPKFGKLITGDEAPYQYLVESIRKFPNQKDFATMIKEAGFSRVSFTNYTGGIAALHSGWKI